MSLWPLLKGEWNFAAVWLESGIRTHLDCGNLFFSPPFFPWQILQQCACRVESGPLRWEVGGWEGKEHFITSFKSLYNKPALRAPTVEKLILGLSFHTPTPHPDSTDRPTNHFSNHAAVIRGADKKSIVLAQRQAAPQMKKNAAVPGHRASKMITLTDPSIMCSVPLPAGENIGCSVPAKCLGGVVGGRGGVGATHPWLGERQNVKRRWWRQKGGFQGQSITAGHEGVNLIAPEGEEEGRRTRKRRHCGGSRRDGQREERRIWEGVGGDRARDVSAVGRWERLLALNVLLQFPKQRK